MRPPAWERLDLDEDEWEACRIAAAEMSLASATRITPHQVAVEYALARTFDEPALAHAPMEDAVGSGTPGTRPTRRRMR